MNTMGSVVVWTTKTASLGIYLLIVFESCKETIGFIGVQNSASSKSIHEESVQESFLPKSLTPTSALNETNSETPEIHDSSLKGSSVCVDMKNRKPEFTEPISNSLRNNSTLFVDGGATHNNNQSFESLHDSNCTFESIEDLINSSYSEQNSTGQTRGGAEVEQGDRRFEQPTDDKRSSSFGNFLPVDYGHPGQNNSANNEGIDYSDANYLEKQSLDQVYHPWGGTWTSSEENEAELQPCSYTLAEVDHICQGPEWSCRGRCGYVLDNANISLPVPCHCDNNCILYRSCCEDFQTECPNEYKKAENVFDQFERFYAGCDDTVQARLIKFCPSGFKDYVKVKQCLNFDQDLSRFGGLFPVTDSNTFHHFRNKACWECWQSRLELGEPLPWYINATLVATANGLQRYDPIRMIEGVTQNPPKQRWIAPLPAYGCSNPLKNCRGCLDGGGIQKKCETASESFVEFNLNVHVQRYCFYCSTNFMEAYGSGTEITCSAPKETRVVDPTYNMYEFTVIFSLRGVGLNVELTTKNQNIIYPWESLECQQGSSMCQATKCVNGVQPESGLCNEHLQRGNMLVHVCLGARSIMDAAAQICDDHDLYDINTSSLIGNAQSWIKSCLEVGYMHEDFEVLDMKPMEQSQVVEFYIQYIFNNFLFGGNGAVELRNCVLLAVSRYLKDIKATISSKNSEGLNQYGPNSDSLPKSGDNNQPTTCSTGSPQMAGALRGDDEGPPDTRSTESTSPAGLQSQDFICVQLGNFHVDLDSRNLPPMYDYNCYLPFQAEFLVDNNGVGEPEKRETGLRNTSARPLGDVFGAALARPLGDVFGAALVASFQAIFLLRFA